MQIVLAIVSGLLILSVFLSLIKNDFWIYKILEYPWLQKLFLIVAVISFWFFYWPLENLGYQLVFGGLVFSMIYLLYKIWPYTRLAKKEMLRVRSNDPANELKIFAANVLEENQQYHSMLEQIKKADADLVFFVRNKPGLG